MYACAATVASANVGSVEKTQKFLDQCEANGGTRVPDGPNGLICQLSRLIPFEALKDAERLCEGPLRGEFVVNTAENFYVCELPFIPPF